MCLVSRGPLFQIIFSRQELTVKNKWLKTWANYRILYVPGNLVLTLRGFDVLFFDSLKFRFHFGSTFIYRNNLL
jgi:hypothetical protein